MSNHSLTITKIENYDNSGTGQTLFAQDHVNTLSATESQKIADRAKIIQDSKSPEAAKAEIKKQIDAIALTNFQKSIGKYLLDVQALKAKTDPARKAESDSTYSAVWKIMQAYDGSQPTYQDMIGRYEANTEKQKAYIADRQNTYDAMEQHTSGILTSSNNPVSVAGSSIEPCVGADCTKTSTGTNQVITDDNGSSAYDSSYGSNYSVGGVDYGGEDEALSFPEGVKHITSIKELDKLLDNDEYNNKNIILFVSDSQKDCSNCKKYAPKFGKTPQNNTLYVAIDSTVLNDAVESSETNIQQLGEQFKNISGQHLFLPHIFSTQQDAMDNKRSIKGENFYSLHADNSFKSSKQSSSQDFDAMMASLEKVENDK